MLLPHMVDETADNIRNDWYDVNLEFGILSSGEGR